MRLKKPRARFGRMVQRDITFNDFEAASKSIEELPTIVAHDAFRKASRELARGDASRGSWRGADELLTRAAQDYLRTELTIRRVRLVRPSERRRVLMKLVDGKIGIRPGNTNLGYAVLSSLIAAASRTKEAGLLLKILSELSNGSAEQYVSGGIERLRHHAPLALQLELQAAKERDRHSKARNQGDVAIRDLLGELRSFWIDIMDSEQLHSWSTEGAHRGPRRRARVSDGRPIQRDESDAGPYFWFCHAVLQQIAQKLPGPVIKAMPDLPARLTSLTAQSLLETARSRARTRMRSTP